MSQKQGRHTNVRTWWPGTKVRYLKQDTKLKAREEETSRKTFTTQHIRLKQEEVQALNTGLQLVLCQREPHDPSQRKPVDEDREKRLREGDTRSARWQASPGNAGGQPNSRAALNKHSIETVTGMYSKIT